jgi:hypothetical protein
MHGTKVLSPRRGRVFLFLLFALLSMGQIVFLAHVVSLFLPPLCQRGDRTHDQPHHDRDQADEASQIQQRDARTDIGYDEAGLYTENDDAQSDESDIPSLMRHDRPSPFTKLGRGQLG